MLRELVPIGNDRDHEASCYAACGRRGDRTVQATPDWHDSREARTTAGPFETSGDWLYDVGVPRNSSVGGGIVTVAPGKGGLGTFSPLLDEAGNSVRGQLAAEFLSHALGLDLFASKAVRVRP